MSFIWKPDENIVHHIVPHIVSGSQKYVPGVFALGICQGLKQSWAVFSSLGSSFGIFIKFWYSLLDLWAFMTWVLISSLWLDPYAAIPLSSLTQASKSKALDTLALPVATVAESRFSFSNQYIHFPFSSFFLLMYKLFLVPWCPWQVLIPFEIWFPWYHHYILKLYFRNSSFEAYPCFHLLYAAFF